MSYYKTIKSMNKEIEKLRGDINMLAMYIKDKEAKYEIPTVVLEDMRINYMEVGKYKEALSVLDFLLHRIENSSDFIINCVNQLYCLKKLKDLEGIESFKLYVLENEEFLKETINVLFEEEIEYEKIGGEKFDCFKELFYQFIYKENN